MNRGDLLIDNRRRRRRRIVGRALGEAVGRAVSGALGEAVDEAVGRALGEAVGRAVSGAINEAVDEAINEAVDGAVGRAVSGAINEAVDGAINEAVDGAVGRAVSGAINEAVGGALGEAVNEAINEAVDGAVGGALGEAVGRALGGALGEAISSLWYHRLGGCHWPTWQAYIAFFRDVVHLDLAGDTWDRSRAYDDAQGAGWWWPFEDFIVVCEPPVELHLEQVAPSGWGSHRLHSDTGPAIRWSDGWGIHAWHGTRVPAWVIENPTVERALAEENTEIRRCAIEHVGWDTVIAHLGADPIDTCPDPGNAPHQLALYRLPDKINPYRQPLNLLLMVNGSPDRSGQIRRYGETVPATITSALDAAAWQFGVSPSAYSQVVRRT